ncbi:MAG TPA: DUF1598 domain-containing protein, partial [Tepidisphaeraceae bacterium]|nr:DUF1598 domain-containing protein [Tepidisphaeraceae bacterium]
QQVPPGNNNPQVFGISVNPDGAIEFRQRDSQSELNKIKSRRPLKESPADADKRLKFVSLVKISNDLRNAIESNKPIPNDLKYLNGLTQIHYVLLYPDEKDLVIAGPAEDIDASNSMQPRGKLTGRPILQLDDLIAALRRANGPDGRKPFGCSIDPPPNAVERAQAVLQRVGSSDRALLAREMAREMGPQQVRLFGAPADSRLVFICVAADYQLKRYTTVTDPFPLAGIGHPVDNSRPAGNGYWFEMNYDKLLVSPDNTAYQIRGPRLQMKVGAIPFDTKGATERAKVWATNVNKNIPALAAAAPIYADLQNIADLALLASLIQKDKLAERASWDISWLLDSSKYTTRSIPIPRTCDTIVNYAAGSLTAGGVSIDPGSSVNDNNRERDENGTLTPIHQRGRM